MPSMFISTEGATDFTVWLFVMSSMSAAIVQEGEYHIPFDSWEIGRVPLPVQGLRFGTFHG